jgi:hypothetical protein
MALPPLPELALFMALVLVLSLYGLTVSGHSLRSIVRRRCGRVRARCCCGARSPCAGC